MSLGAGYRSGAQSQGFEKFNQAVDENPVQVNLPETNVYAMFLENDSGSHVYLHFFNAASTGAVTPGITEPDEVVKVPADGAIIFDANQVFAHFPLGLVVLATTTRAKSALAPTAPLQTRLYTKAG